jgi:hypothetical protein
MQHESEIIERLARIEVHLESLVGNGQPGRIKLLEDQVDGLVAAHNQRIGIHYVLSVLSSAIIGAAVHIGLKR